MVLEDFQRLISRSRAIADALLWCCSLQTSVQGPFFRVNFPAILSVRLWLATRESRCSV